ncbi:MAG: hypothetical protein LQ341_006181, partial [Variospora aurantia]
MTDTIDCLCQTAPHIIIFEPVTPLCRANLYQKMVTREREIYDSKKRRRSSSPQQPVAKRSCPWYRRFTHLEDRHDYQALSSPSEGVKTHGAILHIWGDSSGSSVKDSEKARKPKKADNRPAKQQRSQEKSEKREVVEVNSYVACGGEVLPEVDKSGITVTVYALPPCLSSCPPNGAPLPLINFISNKTTAIFPSPSPSTRSRSSASAPQQRTLPSSSSSSVYSGDSVGMMDTTDSPHSGRVFSWNPSFETIPALDEKFAGEETALLMPGRSGEEEEIKVPAKKWWQRLSIRSIR